MFALGCGVGTNSSPKAKTDSPCDDSRRDRRFIFGGLVEDLGWSPVSENPALRCTVSLHCEKVKFYNTVYSTYTRIILAL